jgi:hypothetical protein
VGPTGGTVDIGAYEFEISGLVAPQEVHARAIGQTRIEITWKAVPHATSYAVERRQPHTEADFKTIARNVMTTRYVDETGTPHMLYEYRVRAQNFLRIGVRGAELQSLVQEARRRSG